MSTARPDGHRHVMNGSGARLSDPIGAFPTLVGATFRPIEVYVETVAKGVDD